MTSARVLTLLATLIAVAMPACAYAQTANPVVLGYMSTSGCLGSVVPCFIPYGSTIPTTGGSGGGVFTGNASISTITSSVTAVISATSRSVLAYQVSGSTSDYACAVWATSAPTFTVSGTGAAASCGVAGSFILSGQSAYPPGTPNLATQALYAQILSGGTVADSFTVSAQW